MASRVTIAQRRSVGESDGGDPTRCIFLSGGIRQLPGLYPPLRYASGRLREAIEMHDVGETEPRWWTTRPARNLKPATYRCPFCNRFLASMSDHLLIAPEGNTLQRRHAHTECVLAARQHGLLPSYDEWRAANPSQGFLAWLLRRGRG